MIFQHTYQQVLDGTKTQTRRLVGDNEELIGYEPGSRFHRCVASVIPGGPFHWSIAAKKRIKWQVDKTYAVQPGRGKPAMGYIRITGIRRQRLQDITDEDAIAEGCEFGKWMGSPADVRLRVRARGSYLRLWDDIHTKKGTTSFDNPEVWVLEFELVK